MAGNAIGTFPTIITVILTAIVGAYLMQRQGLSAMTRTQQSIEAGELPVESMMDGVYLLVAGAFLLTPGFITDAIGFLLFIPPFRRWLGRTALKRFTRNMDVHVSTSGSGPSRHNPHNDPAGSRRPPDGHGPVIDGEFEPVEPKSDTPKPTDRKSSPWRKDRS